LCAFYVHCCCICPTFVKIELKIIPYFTRLTEVDRVGFEPTTSADHQQLFLALLFLPVIQRCSSN
jgi:hypothetical protein